MIKLLFTGATTDKAVQQNAINSIGGHISSSVIANDQIDALFGSISQNSLNQGNDEYRCIAFINDSDQSKNIVLYYNNLSVEPVCCLKISDHDQNKSPQRYHQNKKHWYQRKRDPLSSLVEPDGDREQRQGRKQLV